MSDLTPIPAKQRRAYYDALLAGRAEAERLGYGLMDDRIFAAFHRALYQPLLDAHEAEVRANVAEELQSERLRHRAEGHDVLAIGYGHAARWLSERQEATRPTETAASATETAPARDSTYGSAETRTAGFGTTKTNTTHEETA